MHIHELAEHTAYSTAPRGAKVSDVQFGRHADLCQTERRKGKTRKGTVQWILLPVWTVGTHRKEKAR